MEAHPENKEMILVNQELDKKPMESGEPIAESSEQGAKRMAMLKLMKSLGVPKAPSSDHVDRSCSSDDDES